MEKTKEDTRSLLLRLVLILIILITLAWTFGPSGESGEVKTYTWNKEKGELEEQEIYHGDDFAGALKHAFRGWFEEDEDEE